MPRSDETVSQSVSVLTLSVRIAESGSVTHLPECVCPVSWAAFYTASGQDWQRVAEKRVNEEVQPLLDEIATAEPPADVANLWPSVERWRAATAAEANRDARNRVYERVVSEMRREALTAIDAKGRDFRPTEWTESTTVFRVQGEWTVTLSVSGTDHAAVREAFATGLTGRRDEILADAQKRIPRISGTFPEPRITPEKVRRAWRRDRRKGTVPRPASGAFAPGSWVTWQHPETGQTFT
ncbi:hypothetical protein AB0H07_46550, partial [Streptomyces sp. NPDC021354]|uniref:hypothetical protein n=1 Tax=Streptomyces sp. NPDC021354 TaxID=3154793 RepID=UPI0033FB6975